MSATTQVPAPYTDAPVTPGLPIFTLDNQKLGTVKEVTERHFKVNARFRKDYFVALDQVAYVDAHTVGMLFRSDEAELYRLAQPADDSLQRRFARKLPQAADGASDVNFRGRFPLS